MPVDLQLGKIFLVAFGTFYFSIVACVFFCGISPGSLLAPLFLDIKPGSGGSLGRFLKAVALV